MTTGSERQRAPSGGYDQLATAGVFDEVCGSYDTDALRCFWDGAQALIAAVNLGGDESVLDVGTGTGHVALEVARRFPRCRVVGVDSSPGMLAVARGKRGDLPNVEFQACDWEELERVPGTFDVVTNAFGACFVKDLARFADSVASKVRPGGLFAFSNIGDGAFQPFGAVYVSDLLQMGRPKPPPVALRRSSAALMRLLEERGFVASKVLDETFEYALQRPEQWWEVVTRNASRALLHGLTPAEVEAFRRRHVESVRRMMDEGARRFTFEMTLYVGRAPCA